MYGYYPGGNGGFQPPYNPYQARLDSMQQMQQQNIVQVHGENGAKSYRMPPNSSCLLLDDTAPIVWLAQTDGAGYPTLTAYSITPYQPAAPADNVEARLSRLEAMIYGKSNSSSARPAEQSGTDTDVGTK